MTAINSITDISREGDVAIITLNNPPVNALSMAMRDGLVAGLDVAAKDDAARAILLICAGRTFIAGADISEFDKIRTGAGFKEAQDAFDKVKKPLVAAIHGTALGGGLEVAMCCHYRVAVASAKFGQPEVNLGLIPGAGGTQRLPRLVGVPKALEMIATGKPIGAADALTSGLIDEIVPDDLKAGAMAFIAKLLAEGKGIRRTRDMQEKVTGDFAPVFAFAKSQNMRGFEAPLDAIRAVEAATSLPFDEGIALEHKIFEARLASAQSAALRHLFFAERKTSKIPDVPDDTATLPIKKVGIVGAGTMGGGIAMNFANTGIPVTILEMKQDALDHGLGVVKKNYDSSAAKGRFSLEEAQKRFSLLTGTLKMEDFADCDLIIEAVFERMDVKKDVFARLDKIAKPTAILASNTSFLNIDEIASVTSRPDHVLGLHFFSPANVMKLLEIVRGDKTSKQVIATAMKLARTIGKVGVLVGVAFGFVGNRMLAARSAEADKMVMEGALPWDIDRVLVKFGFPMGGFAMWDLAGLDLGWVKEESKSETLRDLLNEMGRKGQKTGAGYYDYDASRKATPSPVTEKLLADLWAKKGMTPRKIPEQEILERQIYPMINEGAKILEEGKASRASDIDIVWLYGYGFPAWRGGPMFYADSIGLDTVLAGIRKYGWKPSALLEKLVAEKKKFADL
ncbi:MAG TPA: 3-hydroxyacyl-CoA dehydrogenase NAD-binding domain-containing protein [Rhizomicrobium sp.]|nr:3-hydroxyacyl-CoA dehydrogenase NAD-binding domain-containing protein [Rhizomicrobium sp.]